MRILIADDSSEIRDLLEHLLRKNGHEVVTAVDGEDALRKFVRNDGADFDYIVTDYQMPKRNGVVLIMEIRKRNRNQKCILVSGDPPALTKATMEDTGEFPMLRKPYSNDDLLALLV